MVVSDPLSIRGVYVLSFGLAAVICFAGTVGIRGLSHPDIRRGLGGLLALSGFWSLFTAAQMATPSPLAQRVFHVGGLIAGISTIVAWVTFASAYTGRSYHRQRSFQLGSALLLAVIIGVKITNPLHGLYYTTTAATTPFSYLQFSYGSIHWFVTGIVYTVAFVGFGWLFESFERSGSRPRVLYALVGVTALSLVPYALSSAVEPLLRINYEPLGVAVFAVGILRYARTEFANHSSPGLSTLADSVAVGGLVLDSSATVIAYNDEATTILDSEPIPRRPLTAIDDGLASISPGETGHRTYTVGGRERTYEVTRSPVDDAAIAEEVLTLKNVTRMARIERLVRLNRGLTDALLESPEPWELIQRVPERMAAIGAYDLVWLVPVAAADPSVADRSLSADSGPADDTGGRQFRTDTEPVAGVVAGNATDYAEWVAGDPPEAEPVIDAATTTSASHVAVDDTAAEWSQRAADHSITDSLALPVVFDNQQAFVLGVYTTAPNGFDAIEREVIEEIGESVPQVVSTIETHAEALQYEEAMKHAGVAISITDSEGIIQYVNPAFETLTGYSAAEAVGSTHRILKSGEMSDRHYEQLWDTITGGDIFEKQVINRTKGGDRYILQETISPVTNDDGEPEAYVTVQFDITDKLLREQRLAVLNRVLRHNLRTSVNVIVGQTGLLADRIQEQIDDDPLPAAIAASIETIRDRVEHIHSQAETAREIEAVLSDETTKQLWEPVETLCKTATETATDRGARCACSIDGDIGDRRVDGEATRIIEEVVDNAVRHHDRNPSAVEVQVTLSVAGDDLLCTIADDGPGLSEQELVVIEEGAENPLRHGSGLGLWMVNWLAIACGGSISATTDDKGTTIKIRLPLRDTETEPSSTELTTAARRPPVDTDTPDS